MKLIRRGILFCLIILILTSQSFGNVTRFVDFSVKTFNNICSDVESFVLKMSQVTEVQYEEYYIEQPEFNSSYNSLNYFQKEIYKTIYAISQEMPKGFVKLYRKYDGINRDIAVAYNALLYDRTEIFWMPYTYILSDYSYNGIKYTAITFSYNGQNGSTDYNVTKEKRFEIEKSLNKKTEKIIANANKLGSNYEKVKYFNDYICENTEYVTKGFLVSTAYGALVEKKAHCEGYSRALKYLCNKVGIECDLVCGISYGEGHMWNSVSIDGIRSNVDVTWNDRNDYPSYLYFNITDEQMEFDHKFAPYHKEASDEVISKGSFNFINKEASYKGNTFYEKSGYVIELDFEEDTAQKIEEDFADGKFSSEFMFTSEIALSDFKKGETEFVARIQKKLKNVTIDSYLFERDVLTLFYE